MNVTITWDKSRCTERDEHGWIACTHKMPDTPGPHLVYRPGGDGYSSQIALSYYRPQNEGWSDDCRGDYLGPQDVTHWQPLPAPPFRR